MAARWRISPRIASRGSASRAPTRSRGPSRISAGAMRLDGRDLRSLAPHRYCDAGIAIVPEGRRLFTGMTVRENLELGAYRRAAKTHRARSLERVGELFPVLRECLHRPA